MSLTPIIGIASALASIVLLLAGTPNQRLISGLRSGAIWSTAVHLLAVTAKPMKTLILLAGAAALGFASPAIAKPGNGHGNSHKGHKGHSALLHGEHGKGSLYGKGIGGCPPGHAKHPGVCMPHGQFNKLFNVGQRVPLGYRGLLGYDG